MLYCALKKLRKFFSGAVKIGCSKQWHSRILVLCTLVWGNMTSPLSITNKQQKSMVSTIDSCTYISPKIIGYYQHYRFVVRTLSVYVSWGFFRHVNYLGWCSPTYPTWQYGCYLSTVVMSSWQTWACPVGKRWLFSLDLFPQTLVVLGLLLLSYGAPQARGISVSHWYSELESKP